MKRRKVLSLFVSVLMLLGLLVTSGGVAAADPQTLIIYGANGNPGETDPYTEYSMDGGATWQHAYLFGSHPWGFVPGTNSWVNCSPSGTDWACLNRTVMYRIRFVVPGGATDPKMVFDIKADNYATISVNGTQVAFIEGQNSAATDASLASTLHTGMNEIRLDVLDEGGWAGLNYKITITMDAPTPPSPLPGGETPPPDTTPPTITSTRTPANAYGWNNTDVQLTYACADVASDIASCPAPDLVTTEGANQSRSVTAADTAGNTANATVGGINIDKTAPTISGAADRSANAGGWYNGDVTVGFACADALSGVSNCAQPVTLAEGANQSATGAAADKAGNTASATVSGINVDTTAPTITGAADRSANAAGWYNGDVTVGFTCGDALSGVGACATPVTLAEGANQSATGSAADKAGNTASATVSGLNVDTTAATVSYSGNAGTYTVDQQVNITCASADALSGVASDTCKNVSGPAYSYNVGSNTVSATATDKAGNVGTGSTTFTVKVTYGSLCNLTQQFLALNPPPKGDDRDDRDDRDGRGGKGDKDEFSGKIGGLSNAMCVKLDGLKVLTNVPAPVKAIAVNAYINQVQAQSGKALTKEQAAILIRLAKAL